MMVHWIFEPNFKKSYKLRMTIFTYSLHRGTDILFVLTKIAALFVPV